MHLRDINAWLAIAVDSHEHHPLAAQWFLAAAHQSCCSCRLTQLGFLRLLSTPQVMKEEVRTLVAAWQAYDDLFHDPRVV
jgi:predicted nucleic acid-binding protein